MKKYVEVILGIIIYASAQNLLQNPGFESWTSGMPTYWNKDNGVYIFQESSIKHGGNFSVRDSLITQTQSDADLFQTVAVYPNTYYHFSVWVWDNDPAGRIGIGIDWLPTGSEWPNIFSVDSAGWQELTFITQPSPSNAESASVVIRAYDSSATWDGDALFYVDDAYVAAPAIQPPVIVRMWHIPVNPGSGVIEDIYTKVSDDGTIIADTVYYGINNLSSPIKLSHTSISNDTFKFQITGQAAGDTVFYFSKFVDNDGLEVISDTHAYYVGKLNIVLNETLYNTQGSDHGCFIELFGPGGIDLANFSVVGVNGYNGSEYVFIDLSGYSIPSDGFFVIAQDTTVPNYDMVTPDADLQNSPDNVELRFNNITIDALGYGEINDWVFTGEWLPVPDVADDHSLGRYPDGYDTDNNYNDFNDYITCTPGQSNLEIGMKHDNLTVISMPVVTSLVSSGITFSSLIDNKYFYPIIIYNTLGQVIKQVSAPSCKLILPCGIYFIKLNNSESGCVKIIVVK